MQFASNSQVLLPQRGGDLAITAALRVFQGSNSAAVGQHRIGARVEQGCDDLDVSSGTVAQDHSLKQRGSAEIIDVIDVGRSFGHQTDIVDVPALGGRDDRDSTIPIPQGQVRVPSQQHLGHCHTSSHARDQPR
jgi:hypothetical protein